MSSVFVALPVGQGDAFLLVRDGKRILVDGGKSSAKLMGLLSAEAVEHIDIVVCTHNDQDHSEGIAGLLENDVLSIGEVWLPGRWSERIVDLFGPSKEFLDELDANIREDQAAASLEKASRSVPVEPVRRVTNDVGVQNRAESDSDEQRILDAIDSVDERRWPRWWPGHFSNSPWQLWADCLNAAERIRRIAKGARDVGARLRWFDYAEFCSRGTPQGGIAGLLEPVNSIEISPKVAKRRLTAFDFLRLSVANAESLVFHAPDGSEPAVLFCADSDLSFDVPVRAGALVTAPHHGSESNSVAYGVVGKVAPQVTWVRSDGRFQKRPGSTFLQQPQIYCTRCRGKTAAGQSVRFATLEGEPGWSAADGVLACGCEPP